MLKWPFTQTISIWITKAGFAVKIIFFAGIAISDQFEHSSPIWPQLDFLKVGFNLFAFIWNMTGHRAIYMCDVNW